MEFYIIRQIRFHSNHSFLKLESFYSPEGGKTRNVWNRYRYPSGSNCRGDILIPEVDARKRALPLWKGLDPNPDWFGLIFFGALLDITDNFPSLDKYIIIGKTKYADFLEEVVGYLFGFVFVAIGFWKWMPAIVALREEETTLKKSKEELQLKIEELTAELNVIRVQLEQNEVRLQEGHVPT